MLNDVDTNGMIMIMRDGNPSERFGLFNRGTALASTADCIVMADNS